MIYHQKGSSVNFSSAVENVVIKSVDMHDTINLIDIVSVHREQWNDFNDYPSTLMTTEKQSNQ